MRSDRQSYETRYYSTRPAPTMGSPQQLLRQLGGHREVESFLHFAKDR